LKETINKVFNKAGIKSARTKNITKHVLISFIYKGGSIITSFLMVPLTIKFLDTENYGIWLTLSSFIAWFAFFDIGLGHGLRNKFAEAKAKNDVTISRGYVSSAYFTILAVSLALFILFFSINFIINWTKVFNVNPKLEKDLGLLMPIVFGFFCLQLVLKLITTIYTADQHHSMQGKVTFYSQACSLLFIWILTKTSESSLLIFGTIFSAFPVLFLLALNFVAFSSRYKAYKPSIKLWKKKYLKDIFGLGMRFFVIQIAGMILFSTDNIIITQLFGPKEVVPYNIAFKYFSIINMALSLVLTPFWSSVTEAYIQQDFQWIKKSMNNLMKISFLSILLTIFLIFISSYFYKLWIGDKVSIPKTLTITMAIYYSLNIFYTPFTYFINGTGKVKLQMYSIIITAIFNIPLSIFLARDLELGVTGVIVSTIICLLPHVILCPIQYSKLVNNTASGIWNK
jgi:O-antigen/teichoic acid export membrane protein